MIILNGEDYQDSVETMEIKGTDGSRLLSLSKITDFRPVVGRVGYMTGVFIPWCPLRHLFWAELK